MIDLRRDFEDFQIPHSWASDDGGSWPKEVWSSSQDSSPEPRFAKETIALPKFFILGSLRLIKKPTQKKQAKDNGILPTEAQWERDPYSRIHLWILKLLIFLK
jgi:hypothetical protein